jgi:hypothetical protein
MPVRLTPLAWDELSSAELHPLLHAPLTAVSQRLDPLPNLFR